MGLAVLPVNGLLIGLGQQEESTEVLVGNLLRKAIEPCTVRRREKADGHGALLASNVPILLVNPLQRSKSTFSRGSLLGFFAFKEGMSGTPISIPGGWPTVSV